MPPRAREPPPLPLSGITGLRLVSEGRRRQTQMTLEEDQVSAEDRSLEIDNRQTRNPLLLIALVAQWRDQEDGPVVFRVHKSILARSSSVFDDMFSLSAGEAMELYDGVPLVRMPDTGEDLESFLQYLYCDPLLSLKPYDPDMPLKVRPLLRMADKFQVDALREHIVAQLVSDWPQTVRQWDKLESEIKAREDTLSSDYQYQQKWIFVDDQFPEPASAIRLARDFNMPEILGPAFYHLSRINIESNWDASRGVDQHGKPRRLCGRGYRTARWELLEKEYYVSVLRGRHRLKAAAAKALNFMRVPSRSQAEKDQNPCTPKCDAEKLWFSWRDLNVRLAVTDDVLATLRVYAEETLDTFDDHMCTFCYLKASAYICKCRKKLWEGLGEYFGLPAREGSASGDSSSEEEES
ncbi:hypothetical protein EVG20_g7671 [Dentipellis fragilis]|uniref:BTB domain-containing protein n=1 Tax=Dentipellis fragilis TaxID=205917 RepID=A0A4Y9YCZ7_9AGAM|nr:hypothetical protein EVG20_g7671 [Dentipellis fragilis]